MLALRAPLRALFIAPVEVIDITINKWHLKICFSATLSNIMPKNIVPDFIIIA